MPIAVAVVGGAFLFAVGAPLLTYSVALATFGVGHVLWELRYVRQRFGSRVQGGLLAWITLCLVANVVVRAGYLVQAWPGLVGPQAELALVAALAAAVVPILWHAGAARALVAAAVVGVLVFGIFEAPLLTFVGLSLAHNLTPVGFVAEALSGAQQRRALVLCALLFAGVPALIASGIPSAAAASAGLHAPDLTVLGTGPLTQQLGVYLPSFIHTWPSAPALFSAAVFAQCMHYLAVLHLLPRLRGESLGAPLLDGRRFLGITVLVTVIFAGGYALDFGGARGWYGIMAAVHASLEIPLLLLALMPRAPQD